MKERKKKYNGGICSFRGKSTIFIVFTVGLMKEEAFEHDLNDKN